MEVIIQPCLKPPTSQMFAVKNTCCLGFPLLFILVLAGSIPMEKVYFPMEMDRKVVRPTLLLLGIKKHHQLRICHKSNSEPSEQDQLSQRKSMKISWKSHCSWLNQHFPMVFLWFSHENLDVCWWVGGPSPRAFKCSFASKVSPLLGATGHFGPVKIRILKWAKMDRIII